MGYRWSYEEATQDKKVNVKVAKKGRGVDLYAGCCGTCEKFIKKGPARNKGLGWTMPGTKKMALVRVRPRTNCGGRSYEETAWKCV